LVEWKSLKVLEADYPYYKKQVQRFKSNLTWDSVARKHIRLYVDALEKGHKDWRLAPEVTTQKIL
jgi:hypothetical protein